MGNAHQYSRVLRSIRIVAIFFVLAGTQSSCYVGQVLLEEAKPRFPKTAWRGTHDGESISLQLRKNAHVPGKSNTVQMLLNYGGKRIYFWTGPAPDPHSGKTFEIVRFPDPPTAVGAGARTYLIIDPSEMSVEEFNHFAIALQTNLEEMVAKAMQVRFSGGYPLPSADLKTLRNLRGVCRTKKPY